MSFSPESVEENITAQFYGSDGFYQTHLDNYPAWERDEPVPSLFRPIGRLIVAPGLLEQVLAAIAQEEEGEFIYYAGETRAFGDQALDLRRVPPLLAAFAKVSEQRFKSIISQEFPEHLPLTSVKDTFELLCTPYKPNDEDAVLHRDGHSARGATFLSIPYGPRTEYAKGSHRSSDFEQKDDILARRNIPAYWSFPPGTVVVHDNSYCLHEAPAEEHQGRQRLMLRFTVHNYFDHAPPIQ